MVTGAAGFLGREVVADLLQAGYAVRALVRNRDKAARADWGKNVELFEGDLREHPRLSDAFEGTEALIHLAACKHGSRDEQYAATVQGTARLLEAMKATAVKRIVFASSVAIYDYSRAGRELDVDAPLDKAAASREGYAAAKIAQEKLVVQMCRENEWDLTVFRPAMIWGAPEQYPHTLAVRRGNVHFVIGPCKSANMVHVKECSGAIVRCLQDKDACGKIYHLVSVNAPNAWDFMGMYLKKFKVRGFRIPVPYAAAYGSVALFYRMYTGLKGTGEGLPSLCAPRSFAARFRPVAFISNYLARTSSHAG